MSSLSKWPLVVIAAAVSEPEANERGSSQIERRTHFLLIARDCGRMRKELWLCANAKIKMRGPLAVAMYCE